VRRSRSSWIGATLVLAWSVAASTAAHRRDEYLQAARLAIDPDRVALELDLTPGIAVAERVLAEIDADGNGSIAAAEARAYSARVLAGIAVDVDGTPLVLNLIDSTLPELSAVRNGEGSLRLHAAAALPSLSAGTHHLRYRNSHHPDIGVYLANALMPASDRVVVASQRRDVDQRELTVEYTLRDAPATRVRRGLSVAGTAALVWFTAWRRRRRGAQSG
jgi:hypothetical protein